MSPLRFLGSLLVGKISSRRICGQAAGSARLRHLTDGVRGFGFSDRLPIGEKPHDAVAAAVALSAFLGGGIWYFNKEDAQKPVARKLTDGESLKESYILTVEEALKEEAMKKRFEEWMIKYRRRYKDEEEKAWRYELFKRRAQDVDEANARGSATFATNDFSDETEEVRLRSLGSAPTMEEFERLKLRLRELGLNTS